MEEWIALVLAAPSPSGARGLFELFAAMLAATKWPALGLCAGAGYVSYSQYQEGNEGVAMTAALVSAAAFGWFVGGLTA